MCAVAGQDHSGDFTGEVAEGGAGGEGKVAVGGEGEVEGAEEVGEGGGACCARVDA